MIILSKKQRLFERGIFFVVLKVNLIDISNVIYSSQIRTILMNDQLKQKKPRLFKRGVLYKLKKDKIQWVLLNINTDNVMYQPKIIFTFMWFS